MRIAASDAHPRDARQRRPRDFARGTRTRAECHDVPAACPQPFVPGRQGHPSTRWRDGTLHQPRPRPLPGRLTVPPSAARTNLQRGSDVGPGRPSASVTSRSRRSPRPTWLHILAPIWHAEPETARRVRQRIGAGMKWAVAMEHRPDKPGGGGARPGAWPANRTASSTSPRSATPRWAAPSTSSGLPGGWAGTKLAFESLVLTAARRRRAARDPGRDRSRRRRLDYLRHAHEGPARASGAAVRACGLDSRGGRFASPRRGDRARRRGAGRHSRAGAAGL